MIWLVVWEVLELFFSPFNPFSNKNESFLVPTDVFLDPTSSLSEMVEHLF